MTDHREESGGRSQVTAIPYERDEGAVKATLSAVRRDALAWRRFSPEERRELIWARIEERLRTAPESGEGGA